MSKYRNGNWLEALLSGVVLLGMYSVRAMKQNNKIDNAQHTLQRSQDYLLLNNKALATERFGGIDCNVVCPSCNPYYVKRKWNPPIIRTKIFKLGVLERFFKGKETETKATCTLCLSQWVLPEQVKLVSTKKQIVTKVEQAELEKVIKEQATLEAMERKKRLAIRDAKWKAEAKTKGRNAVRRKP
ncbi:MAG: hypothetical protein ACXWTK_04225 [Methylobacter sp.]